VNRKRAAALAVGAILVIAVGAVAYQQLRTRGGKTRQVRVTAGTAATQPATVQAWRSRFDSVYRLGPNEVLKLVPPPWIPERFEFHRERISESNTTGATALIISEDARGKLAVASSMVGFGGDTGGGYTVSDILSDLIVPPQEVDLPPTILKTVLRGDIVYRSSSSLQERLPALMQVIAPIVGRRIELVRRPVERDVIIVSGKFKLQPLADAPSYEGRPTIHLFVRAGEPASLPSGVGGGTAAIRTILDEVGDITGYPIVYDNPLGSGLRVNWRQQESVVEMQEKRIGPADAAEVDALLANVAKQTSLELKRGRRTIEMWTPKE